jgi:hypothetical protein
LPILGWIQNAGTMLPFARSFHHDFGSQQPSCMYVPLNPTAQVELHLQCTCGNDMPSYGPNFIVPANCKPPTELRLQIFRISAQHRSIHVIQHQAESFEQLIAKRRMYTILSPLISTEFHICRELRAERMRHNHFEIHNDHHGGLRLPNLHC